MTRADKALLAALLHDARMHVGTARGLVDIMPRGALTGAAHAICNALAAQISVAEALLAAQESTDAG